MAVVIFCKVEITSNQNNGSLMKHISAFWKRLILFDKKEDKKIKKAKERSKILQNKVKYIG